MTSLPQLYEDRIDTVIKILGQNTLGCLTNITSALGECIDVLVSEQPEFHQTNISKVLKEASGPARCQGTHVLLLGNCVNLLNAGILLLLSGYNGRALSCIRDVNESLRFADSCLYNPDSALNWLEGKKPRKPRRHEYPSIIEEDKNTEKILNTWGTHSDYESTMSAWFSRFRYSGELGDFDKFFILRDFATLLNASCRALSYVLGRHTHLIDRIADVELKLQTANSLVQAKVVEVVQLYNNLVGNEKD